MIILSNDDGFNARGLRTLRDEVARVADVVIVAPENEQSAMGHAITLTVPLKVREVREKGEFIGYAVNGTPADCIKIAVSTLLPEPPEMVISGINQGGNLGTCVIYSGTVSAATEAIIMGIPAIAVSLNSWESTDFSTAAEFIRQLIPVIRKNGLPQGVALNINVPAVPRGEIQGVAITRQGKSRVIETFDRRVDPRKNIYYWMAGEMRFDEVDEETDCEMVAENYISITPIHYDLTCFPVLEELKRWNLDLGWNQKPEK
ncbi:MAG: 5'/3'-nucleotidase SurE [Nitrospinae bacterium CG11_big_fil_rev_8_21_14_0_20_56_8]|nr:MAG: 5'/3'-nucleotidase SurE [Nitrospinae bacterium CG11_big_fil_rev_8_21_14_0_20_56_8]